MKPESIQALMEDFKAIGKGKKSKIKTMFLQQYFQQGGFVLWYQSVEWQPIVENKCTIKCIKFTSPENTLIQFKDTELRNP